MANAYQLQELDGVSFIVLDRDLVKDSTDCYFEQIKQPDGSILLRLVEVGNPRK